MSNNLWSLFRSTAQPQALHYSYEKAGLVLDNQPIAWNADAVLVEAQLRPPSGTLRSPADFALRIPGWEAIPPENVRDDGSGRTRLFFRFNPPAQTVTAEVLWKDATLGQVTLPILGATEFFQKLTIQAPTVHALLGTHTVACQAFISTQSKGILATALLSSPTSLAPLHDSHLTVEICDDAGGIPQVLPIHLTGPQLRQRQALVAVQPTKFPRRLGSWQVHWKLDDRLLASQRIRALSRPQFQRSLRISGTRFVLQDARGAVSLAQKAPKLEEVARAGPCFLVSSRELGMAGSCLMQVRIQVPGAIAPPLLHEQEYLVTDGILAIAPGTVPSADLAQASGFELWANGKPLGSLLLTPAPIASFTSEGGFKAPPEFAWSAAAEEQLTEKLNKLLNGR